MKLAESFWIVLTKLGSGLLEKVYRECLAYELRKCGLEVKQEKISSCL